MERLSETDPTLVVLAQDSQKLKKCAAILFGILIAASTVASITVLFVWLNMTNIHLLTNAYQAYFGFMVACVLNIIGCIGGMVTLLNLNIDGDVDKAKSLAVCMLLCAGLVFNIIFPTTALIPLEIDSRKRIPVVPLLDCLEDSFFQSLPECTDARQISIGLYCMYPLILIELIGLITYSYIRQQQFKHFDRAQEPDQDGDQEKVKNVTELDAKENSSEEKVRPEIAR